MIKVSFLGSMSVFGVVNHFIMVQLALNKATLEFGELDQTLSVNCDAKIL